MMHHWLWLAVVKFTENARQAGAGGPGIGCETYPRAWYHGLE